MLKKVGLRGAVPSDPALAATLQGFAITAGMTSVTGVNHWRRDLFALRLIYLHTGFFLDILGRLDLLIFSVN